MQNLAAELEQEQAYVSMLYRRLDTLRERAQAELERALRYDGGGNVQARVDRDAFVARHSGRLAQLAAAEHGLCFGRLDRADGSHLYIGRLGLLDEDREPLLVDWRAPAAQPFYRATWAAPDGVVRRRHLRTRGRAVLGIEDDVLDLDGLSEAERDGLSGEAALLAALTASRTGRMTDIVATIQAEQDRIIRSDLPGVLVVQGGPGTGKTAVALHRAAFLLYTHRQRLARRGVLVVGPNPTFLRTSSRCCRRWARPTCCCPPWAGCSRASPPPPRSRWPWPRSRATRAWSRCWPRPSPTASGSPTTTSWSRSAASACAWTRRPASAARERARPPATPTTRPARGSGPSWWTPSATRWWPPSPATCPRSTCPRTTTCWSTCSPTSGCSTPTWTRSGPSWPAPAVRSALDRLWPRLTPQRLVGDLLASAERLAAAGAALDPAERDLLLRPARPAATGVAWTPADVPLLDEAAVLLGDDGARARRAEARQAEQDRAELAYAREVLAGSTIGDAARYAPDTSALDPSVLAGRWRSRGPEVRLADGPARTAAGCSGT